MNDEHVINFNFYLNDCLSNVTVDEATHGFPTLLRDLYDSQEVGAKRARDKDVDHASFLPITPSIGEDGESILLSCGTNRVKSPINPLLLICFFGAHVVVGNTG